MDPTELRNESRSAEVLPDSEALRRNLEETAVEGLIIDPRYQILQEVVKDYRGLRKTVDGLLFELNHPYRNWQVILPELRSFALKNLEFYVRHPKGHLAVECIIQVFLDAMATSRKNEQQEMAMDYALAYLEKVVQTPLDGETNHILSVLDRSFNSLLSLPADQLELLAKTHHSLKRIWRGLVSMSPDGFDYTNFNQLLTHALRLTYRSWIEEEDPLEWFKRECGEGPPGEEAADALKALSHAQLRRWLQQVEAPEKNPATKQYTEQLLLLPGQLDIVRQYRELPERLTSCRVAVSGGGIGADPLQTDGKILFLFKIMETPGLIEIHEETLRGIQRSLTMMIRSEPPEQMESFLLRTFELLKANVSHYPRTALQCIQAIGNEVFQKKRSKLVEMFLEQVVQFGFQPPEVTGVDAEWQWLYNDAHLLNLRVWLDLISLNPKWCTTLLSALIINLKLGGTCIRDTDLFQKDISKLLNSEIQPVFNLVKQLTKLIPSFFNEIGAEGLVRDVSTEIDEIHLRKDPLIHFLRKQSHVQSSNLIVEFIEEIFRFWLTRDKAGLQRFLPHQLYQQVQTAGPYVEAPNRILSAVSKRYPLDRIRTLLDLPEEQMAAWVSQVKKSSGQDKSRVLLLFRMYRLVYQKYYLGFQEIQYHLSQAKAHGFPGLDRLMEVLARGQTEPCLEVILDYLELLKDIILSPDAYEVIEDIYHKRHIAADIPSTYGRYYERKFDALGLSLRLENLANVYFERLIESVNLSFITRSTFFNIIKCIRLFIRAMQVDGVSSQRLDTHLKLLETSLEIKRFTYTQYLDIIRGLSEGVKDILNLIIHQLGRQNILPIYVGRGEPDEDMNLVHQVSERFLRDIIASTFGLQYLDNFLTKIHQTLSLQDETLSEEDLDLLMTYDPEKVICHIHAPDPLTNDLIHLGAKGYNLARLASDGIPVPPGFIVTTEVFRCHGILKIPF
jgi:pyruvate,orthophosphate dikinase